MFTVRSHPEGNLSVPVTVLAQGETLPAVIGSHLADVLGSVWDGVSEVTCTFDVALDDSARVAVVNAAQGVAKRAAQQLGWSDSLTAANEWDQPVVTFDRRFEPAFAGANTDADVCLVGFWLNPTTFHVLIIDSYDSAPDRGVNSWVCVTHWHPESMTSGVWCDELFVLAPGVVCEHRFLDDDGSYYTLVPQPDTEQGTAAAIYEFLNRLELFGAEIWLPALYHLLGDGIEWLGDVPVDSLPFTENPGYTIDSVVITPPDAAVEAVRRLGTITPEERDDLRDAIFAFVAEEEITFADLPEHWAVLINLLQPATDS